MLLVCTFALPAAAVSSVTVSVGTATARPGDTVTVPVTFSAVEDLVGVELHLQYDTTVLEYVDGTVEGFLLDMDMATVNQAASAPDQVWLSGMSLRSVQGEGVVYTMTFRVKQAAPEGTTTIGFADHHHMLLFGADMAEAPLDLQGGSVTVTSGATPASTVPVTPDTTTATAAMPQGVQIVLDESGEPVTRNDGQTVTLSPPNTVVDLVGAVVTDAAGEAVTLPNVAVMVDQLTGDPGDEVTVAVSLSPIADMESLEITITYDANALAFQGGEGTGFVGEHLRVREATAGEVVLQANYTAGMSGDGDIALLRFTIKETARATAYRLGLNPMPRLMVGTAVLGVQPFAGEIRVLSDGAAANTTSVDPLVLVLITVIVAAVAAVIVLTVVRRKKGTAAPRKPRTPRTTDVSGDE